MQGVACWSQQKDFNTRVKMNEIDKIIAWAQKNTKTSHDSYTLVVGSCGDNKFRIFPLEGWVGVIGPNGNWTQAQPCYTLEQFVEKVTFTQSITAGDRSDMDRRSYD
jgi:hypothetical protein